MIISKKVEDKILACLCRVQEFASVSSEFLKPKLFSSDIDKNISKIALDCFKSYRTLITPHIFAYEIKKLIENKTIKDEEKSAYVKRFSEFFKIDLTDWNYVLKDQLVPFCKDRAWRKLMEDSLKKHLPKGDFKSIETKAKFIENIGEISQVEPVETWSQNAIENRFENRIRELSALNDGVKLKIPFGIKKLDTLFNGGIGFGELIVFAAGAKIGKTFSMTYFAKAASMAGFNVAYFSYETSISIIQSRLDADISNIETNKVTINAETVKNSVAANIPNGEIYFFKYSAGQATADTVKRDVQRLEAEKNKKIHLVIVDYLDISKRIDSTNDDNINEKLLWESYRGVGEELGVGLLSASQMSTKKGNKSIAGQDGVLGSSLKIATADGVILLSGTEKDLREGRIYVNTSACRNVEKKIFSIKTNYKYGRFFESIDQDEIL